MTELEDAKKKLAEDREAQAKRIADADERQKGKPTPTQEENDLAKMGVNVAEKEDDGSGPERLPGETREAAEARVKTTTKESKPAATTSTYQTRQTKPAST
jgi:hypothetical protein